MAVHVPKRSPLRSDQAAAVRERILDAAIEVIETGEEPTMRAVARAAEIGERTLFRYFPSREELLEAVLPVIRERASAPMAEDIEGLPEYVRRLFTTFERNAQLARALATAGWFSTRVTRPANLRALRKIIDTAFEKAPTSARESAAASLRVLYSAAAWVYLADSGFGLEDSIRHVQWNTKLVLDALQQLSGGKHA